MWFDIDILLLEAYLVINISLLLCLQDIGAGKGKYYAVNFPLRDGIDDECYEQVFQPVMMSSFAMSTKHCCQLFFVNDLMTYEIV